MIKVIILQSLNSVDGKSDENNLFSNLGPLSSLHGRILVCHHLGWISADQKNKLDAFRKLRNKFAHRAFEVSLGDEDISKLIKSIEYPIENSVDMTAQSISEYRLPSFSELTENQRFLCQIAKLGHQTIWELIVLPRAQRHHIDPGSIEEGDKSPVLLHELDTRINL